MAEKTKDRRKPEGLQGALRRSGRKLSLLVCCYESGGENLESERERSGAGFRG